MDLLSRHRDVLNFSEANDVWDPTGYPWVLSSRETLPPWVDPTAFTKRWWRDTKPRAEEIAAMFGAYQWLSRRRVFLNKTPLNTFRIPHLVEMFPEARFVHIVRDGRATTSSYVIKEKTKIERSRETYETVGAPTSFDELALRLARFWRENLDEVARQNSALKLAERGKMLEVTYEELCADKRDVLTTVCTFIGLNLARFSPAVWDIEVTNQNRKWREHFDEKLVARMVSEIGPALAARGYD